jgi:hypothetical protein
VLLSTLEIVDWLVAISIERATVKVSSEVGITVVLRVGEFLSIFPVTTKANFWSSLQARPLSVVTTTTRISPAERAFVAIVVFSTLF